MDSCDCKSSDIHDYNCCFTNNCTFNTNHSLPSKNLFNCKNGSGIDIPIPSFINPTFNPIPIVNTKLDTICLSNPNVKINFNSIIHYKVISPNIVLNNPFIITFQLSKICNNTSKIILSTFDYAYGSVVTTDIRESFNFNYCEYNICPTCSVYLVEIIRVTGIDPVAAFEEASITNSFISVNAISN